jgi:hypothetical protein
MGNQCVLAEVRDRICNDFGALVVVSAATGATPTKIRHTLQARVLIRVIGLLQFGRKFSQTRVLGVKISNIL